MFKLTRRITVKLLICALGLVSFTAVGAQVVQIGRASVRADVIIVRFRAAHQISDAAALLPPGFAIDWQFVDPARTVLYGGFLKLPEDGTSILSLGERNELLSAEDRLTRTFSVRCTRPLHPSSAVAEIAKLEGVEIAEPWYLAESQGNPNDPLWAQQQGLRTMKMSLAWDVSQGDANVTVAVSDNGVDQSHEDLSGSLWTNTGEIPNNLLDDDNNGQVDDYKGVNFNWKDDGSAPGNTTNHSNEGHGTKVAGIASATTNNSKGQAGVANRCTMFPMKTAPKNGGGIVYGYPSLIYAADMGFDVVNCSWGITKPWSPVDQSVIDYCLAKNVVVVASAGNHGNGSIGTGWDVLNFPSAYDGVIGVGECTPADVVAASSGLGKNAMVIAPGTGATATMSGGGYTSSNINGTSFASPMGAGVAALIRSKYPQLDPREVAALMRRTADDITSVNPDYAHILSGRINAQKALTTDPTSIPAVRIASVRRNLSDGTPASRFGEGDTLEFTYQVTNDLASATDVTCQLEIVDDNAWGITFLNDTEFVSSIDTKGNVRVGPFRVVVQSIGPMPCIFGLRFSAINYEDVALDYVSPPSQMSTMQNGQLVYSVGDDGTFGYSSSLTTRQGVGFNWLQGYNLLSPSGFILCEGGARVLKGFDNVNNRSEFQPEKPYTEPQRNTCIMNDSSATVSRHIGIRVEQKCTFPSYNAQATVLSITVENRSGVDLNDVSAGHLFDWDIGYAGQFNFTRLAPEAMPTSFRELGEAQAFERSGYPAAVVVATVSNELSFEPQAAGMILGQRVSDPDGLTDEDVLTVLTSGVSIQTLESGDVCGVLGMKFPGVLRPAERRSFMIVIGVGSTLEEAADIVRQTILEPNSVHETLTHPGSVYPIPADDILHVIHESDVERIEIVDVTGRIVAVHVNNGFVESSISVAHLPIGTFMCRMPRKDSGSFIPFAVVR